MKDSWGVRIMILALLCGLLWQTWQRGQWEKRAQDLQDQIDSTQNLLGVYTRDSLLWQRSEDSLRAIVSLRGRQAAQRIRMLDSVNTERLEAESALVVLRSGVNEDSLTTPVKDLLEGERRYSLRASQALQEAVGVIEAQEEQIDALEGQVGLLTARIGSLETLKTRLQNERDSARVLMKPPSPFSFVFELGAGPGCTLAVNGQAGCGISVQATVVRFRIPLFN